MSEQSAAPHAGSDGLWRWLAGGLVGGGIVLGLLIAAYAIGYHRGQHHPHATAAAGAQPAPTTSTTATTTTTAPSASGGPVPVTAALVARGKSLFQSDGCSGCHSLSGAVGAGPTFKGLAGSTVTLATGQTVGADDAYLERSIADPDAQVVKGFQKGLMSAAISSYGLAGKPADIQALVAFIKSQR